MPNDDFFKKKIAALLHDSPNKPWIISGELKKLGGHEEDAKDLATSLFGDEIARLIGDKDVKESDKLAASFDRWILSFLMGGDYERGAFLTKDVKLFNLFYCKKPYEASLKSPQQYQQYPKLFIEKIKTIHEQVLHKGGWRLAYITFYAIYEYLWSLGPADTSRDESDKVRETECKYFDTLGPADTRIPTHTVFDHTYATASTLNIVGKDRVDGFMVAIDLGGVQNFISASRKLRDLWASSWLTSSLAWSIVSPFIKNFGPDVLVLPTARGNPFFYHTLICMLNERNIKDIPDDIKEAACLAGYEIDLGYPRHAVVPATITLILPSTTSHQDNAKLKLDEEDKEELSDELELSDENNIDNFIRKLYLLRWKQLRESVFDAIPQSRIQALRHALDSIGLKDSPPLPLRVAVVKIHASLPSNNAYLAYHKAFQELSHKLRESAALKISPPALLNLTEYTMNYHKQYTNEPRFYTCSVCGEVPAIPQSLEVAREINSNVEENLITIESVGGQVRGERLCPYCLIKRLSTTKNVFPRVVKTLLKEHRNPNPPRFPSVASVAAINFKKAVVDVAKKKREDIIPLLSEVIKSKENINEILQAHVAYGPEQELLREIENFSGDDLVLGTFVIGDAEDMLLIGEQRDSVSRLIRSVKEILLIGEQRDSVMKIPPSNLDTYYALIKGDGDDVGKVISGYIGDVKAISSFKNIFQYLSNLTPNDKLRDILCKIGDNKLDEVSSNLSKKPEEIQELLNLLRESLRIESDDEDRWKRRLLVSPAYHANLSRSLMMLATKISKEVSNARGFVVYSGGDDVLAVSPVEDALNVICTIRRLYKGEPMGFLKQDGVNVNNLVPSLGDLGQSFAVTYTHYRYPFSRTLAICMNALEEEAKNIMWLGSNTQRSVSEKDSVTVTYVPRSGSQIQARLPFRTKDDQIREKDDEIGELIKMLINILKIIEKGQISANLVKDLEEWMGRIEVAYTARDISNKIIEYVIDRNVTRSRALSSKDREEVKKLLTKGLDLVWRYIDEPIKGDHAKKLLVKELVATLQAEIGARRGVES